MRFKSSQGLAATASLFLVAQLFAEAVHTEHAIFEVSPSNCVVMRSNHSCPIDIRLSWTLIEDERLICLREFPDYNSSQPLCWPEGDNGQALLKREMKESTFFELYDADTGEILAEHSVEKKWVYGPKKRSFFSWLIRF